MKKIFLLMAFALASLSMMAIPAKRITKEITLTDGTSLQATLTGDENMHFWLGTDGKKYAEKDNGSFQEITDTQFSAIRKKALSRKAAIAPARAKALKKTAAQSSYTGTKRGLVILVNFSDKKMTTGSQSAFDAEFNQEGYSQGGHIGSVHDYFKDQSYGVFDWQFDVVGPVTVSKSYSYYGANDSDGNDKYPAQMVLEACKLVDSQVDFSQYDWDGDGEVDQVFVIFAGYTEAHGASENTIWAHSWSLKEAAVDGEITSAPTLDGVKVGTYACSSELCGSSGSTLNPIGTACHEFAHCLGYPDIYDTDYSGGFAMDTWDILSSGSYNGPIGYGEVPAGFTAYERMYAGWLTPIELSTGKKIADMKALTDSPEAYIIYNDAHKDEYYLLENRQQKSWDSYLYGHGMLVVHVDYNEKVWEENTPNDDPDHQRLNIIPADNQFMTGYYDGYEYATASDLAGDPYPGTKKNTALTDTSTPAAKLFNANTDGRKYMGKPIEDITESSDGLISFKFMGGIDLGIPTAQDPTNVEAGTFTAHWSSVAKADSYTIQLKESTAIATPESSLIMSEDCSKLSSVTSDGSQDISSSLDGVMNNSGWSGYKVYKSASRLKIGSSKISGYLTSPTLDTPSSGAVTLVIKAQGYTSSANVSTTITAADQTASIIIQPSTVNTYYVTFKDITSDFTIKIAPKLRAYISGINIYDGEFTADDFNTETAVGDVQTIEGITDTCYTFTDLTGDCYIYKVRAVNNEGEGSWSNSVKVDLSSVTLKGDVNGDGTVNVGDVSTLVGLILENYSTKDSTFTAADVNGDGYINVADLSELVSIIMSSTTE